jgi:hypothetical protein
MNEDERFNDVKRLLDLTIERLESLFRSSESSEDTRSGNGWNPAEIPLKTYVIEPIPADRAFKIAESNKTRLFATGMARFLRPRQEQVKIEEPVVLKLIPFWKVQGFHECLFLRSSSYEVRVPDDVVAVEVEGKVRSLRTRYGSLGILARLQDFIARLVRRRMVQRTKFLRLEGGNELARQLTYGSLVLNGKGDHDIEVEDLLTRKTPKQRLSCPSDFKLSRVVTEVLPSEITKEKVVMKLHARIVKQPRDYDRIVDNRFEITELSLFYVPRFIFRLSNLMQTKTLSVDGVTGEILG